LRAAGLLELAHVLFENQHPPSIEPGASFSGICANAS
jgi:hypothetical protein